MSDLKSLIEKEVEEKLRFISANRERLIEAWIAETGLLPSESVLVEQRFSDRIEISVRRKNETDPR